jgi:pyridoxal phosphate enzyme (YggS family)
VSFAERLTAVHARIADAARRAHRDVASVRLVAVSKTQSVDAVREAVAAGQALFGENRAQELVQKADAVAAEWHFIGHLQTNKVRQVVGRAALIHGVDSLALAEEIARRKGPPVLVQVNTSGEKSKSGVDPSDAIRFCTEVAALCELRGLMTIPAPTEDPEESRSAFRVLRELAAEGHAKGLGTHELSMGMSDDFEVAIEEGATLVRLGTILFGPRSSPVEPPST